MCELKNVSIDEFIDFMNEIHNQKLNNSSTITILNNYIKNHNINMEWLNDQRINFNNSDRPVIIDSLKQVINNDFKNYDEFVSGAKQYLFDHIIPKKPKNKPLLEMQYQMMYNDIRYFKILPIDMYYNINDYEELKQHKAKMNEAKEFIDKATRCIEHNKEYIKRISE